MDNTTNELAKIRVNYNKYFMKKSTVDKDPIQQFDIWMKEALATNMREPNAMTLSTATKDGKPSARTVLLKDFDRNGFVFFTNYESKKSNQLMENPYAALTFFWNQLERQVKIEGVVERTSDTESDEYFNSRPIGSRIGANISPQSKEIPNREFLEDQYNNFRKTHKDEEISRPGNWGGYRVKPYRIEFWQGRPNRLHDRIQFSLTEDGDWEIKRLAP